jgi:hypothetical protein
VSEARFVILCEKTGVTFVTARRWVAEANASVRTRGEVRDCPARSLTLLEFLVNYSGALYEGAPHFFNGVICLAAARAWDERNNR